MEPEAELLPFYKKQNKTWRDLLGALEVRSIPVQTLDTMKLFDIHKELARGNWNIAPQVENILSLKYLQWRNKTVYYYLW